MQDKLFNLSKMEKFVLEVNAIQVKRTQEMTPTYGNPREGEREMKKKFPELDKSQTKDNRADV